MYDEAVKKMQLMLSVRYELKWYQIQNFGTKTIIEKWATTRIKHKNVSSLQLFRVIIGGELI